MPRLTEARRRAQVEKIRHAALQSFATKGYDATSMRDLARDAGFSIGGLYTHFDTKEAILESVAESFAQRRQDVFSTINPDSSEGLAEALLRLTSHLDSAEGRAENAIDLALLSQGLHCEPIGAVNRSTDADYIDLFTRLADGDETMGTLATALFYGLLILSAFNPETDREGVIRRVTGEET